MLTDEEIDALLSEKKPISKRQRAKLMRPTTKKGNRNKTATVKLGGSSGRIYLLKSRQPKRFAMRFSVILQVKHNGRWVNLVRHNGHHGEHPNHLEGTVVPADTCHIHRITARYMSLKVKSPESYAEATDEYCSFEGAVDYMCEQYGIYVHDDPYRGGLFAGGVS